MLASEKSCQSSGEQELKYGHNMVIKAKCHILSPYSPQTTLNHVCEQAQLQRELMVFIFYNF